jgi:preprotein translocase subunit SecA
MTLEQLYEQINQLTDEELSQLQDYVKRRLRQEEQARAKAILEAFADMREGLTEAQLDQLEWAINYRYVEPDDDRD